MEVSNGSLEIKKRRVVLTSDSAQKGFDGTALTAETVTATEFNKDTGEGFVPLDDLILIYDFTGSQTAVGASKNTFTYKVDNELNDTKLSNYDVQTEYGLLQVLPTLNIQKRLHSGNLYLAVNLPSAVGMRAAKTGKPLKE